MRKLILIFILLLIWQPWSQAQPPTTSDVIYQSVQSLRSTEFHHTLEKQRKSISSTILHFKEHLAVYPVDPRDSTLLEIKAAYAKVRNQYNFALERLKLDMANPVMVRKMIRRPQHKTRRYLGEINKANEDFRYYVQRPIDKKMEGAYSSFPVFEIIIGAWTAYQVIEKIIKHFGGLSQEWKQEYAKVAPDLLETYYFADLRLPTWDELQ